MDAATVSRADFMPIPLAAVGAKVTRMVQTSPGFSTSVQVVLVMENPALEAPTMAAATLPEAWPPLFVTVNCWTNVCPSCTEPKSWVVGANTSMAGLVAFPDSGTDSLTLFPVTLSEADFTPAVLGAKKTVMEQVPLGGTDWPLHPSEFLNSLASAPSIVELSEVGVPPVLVTVK